MASERLKVCSGDPVLLADSGGLQSTLTHVIADCFHVKIQSGRNVHD
jgi:hypothetical protein